MFFRSDWQCFSRGFTITVENCDGVTLKNFSIDWDIPLTAQARVTKVGSDFFEIEINVLESPYIIEDGKLVGNLV